MTSSRLLPVWAYINSGAFYGLTVSNTSQGLVEGGRVTVIGERHTHPSGQKPSGQREGLLVLEEPRPEALIVHLVTLQKHKHVGEPATPILLFK